MAATYSPRIEPSTIGHGGLNFSVGMGRGEHRRHNHHKEFKVLSLNFKVIRHSFTYNLLLLTYNLIIYILEKLIIKSFRKNRIIKIKHTGN